MNRARALVEIEALASGGRGVARPGGRVWLVAGGLPGDLVEAETEQEHARWIAARALTVLRPSPARREPACPLQLRCGGCPWMGLAEEEQRRWKRQMVVDALQRIGATTVDVSPLIFGTRAVGYRNKVELSVGRRDAQGEPYIGFRASDGPIEIVDVESCPVQSSAADSVLRTLREVLLDPTAPWSRAFDGRGTRIAIRHSTTTGRTLIALHWSGGPFPGGRELAQRLTTTRPDLAGVVQLVAPRGRRGGTRARLLAGESHLRERVDLVDLEVPAASFFQVNTEVATLLVREAASMLGPLDGQPVFDLYAGVGTIGLNLAHRGARVTLFEADRSACAAALRTARRHGLRSIDYRAGDVARGLEASLASEPPVAVIANPPRGGLSPAVIAAIVGSPLTRLVLVSCDPATLARDVRRLVEGGFAVGGVVPFDMFPQTAHVETLLALHRPPRGSS